MKISIKKKIKKNAIFAKEPDTEEEFHAMGNALVLWAEEESSLNIDEFPLSLRILPERFQEFSKKSDYFDRALRIALLIIGTRRERLAMQGTINQRIVLATMPLYDQKYREWLLHLKHMPEEETKPKTFNVYLGDPSVGEPSLIAAYEVPSRN